MASSAGGAFGVRRPGRFEVPDLPWDDVGHRQGLRDRFDEAVGEDEQTLRSLMEQGAAMEGSRVPGGFGVVSPSRVSPGSFTQDPGMRAADEFQDVTSAGYREAAERVAERGGAKEYATSVGQEEAEAGADELRNAVALILASLIGGGAVQRGAMGYGMRGVNPVPRGWRDMSSPGRLGDRARTGWGGAYDAVRPISTGPRAGQLSSDILEPSTRVVRVPASRGWLAPAVGQEMVRNPIVQRRRG